jgi:hypothetical protein
MNLRKRNELVCGIYGREMNSYEESKENTCWIGTLFNMEEDIGSC